MRSLLAVPFLALFVAALSSSVGDVEARTIAERSWHLGNDETPEWDEAALAPEGTRVDIEFPGREFAGEGTLALFQRSVGSRWRVEINGKPVAELKRADALGEHYYSLPADTIVSGPNRLAIVPDDPNDDITVGRLRYFEAPLRTALGLLPVRVRVTDRANGAALPARVTVTDREGELARLFFGETLHTAVRNGLVYTSSGVAEFELPPGDYAVYALRGTEWSLARGDLSLAAEGSGVTLLELELERELDTTGFVAADTHIHTLTHSGHGDASVEERMVTLAGEGVELAVATDHNHNIDYRPTQEAMGLSEYFTPVVGNEVTTPIGHLNAFPLDPDAEVPLHDSSDLPAILTDIRAKGADVIVLNHPRWPDHARGPHGVIGLNPLTGDWSGAWSWDFDALELINSDTEEPDSMALFRDWFGLLNRGEDLRAVASSDSHAVGVVVGQGRTYVRSSTDVPAELDVEECATNIARGHSSLSMGLFIDVRRDGRSILGETIGVDRGVDGVGATLATLEVRVAAPSWARATSLTLYVNGRALERLELPAPEDGGPFDRDYPVDGELDWPRHDFWLVAIAEGDGLDVPWWPLLNDYTLAASNPVFVDVDGDGRSSSAREIATGLLAAEGDAPDAVKRILARVDSATAIQVMREVHAHALARAQRGAFELAREALERHPELERWIDSVE